MVKHFIIMSKSYSDQTRIALDIFKSEEFNEKYITGVIEGIKSACGEDTPISTHSICSDAESWASVIKTDLFFKGVKIIDSVEEFIMKINRGRVLTGRDVAQYILSKLSCTHLKLEKLCYLCYADYLIKGNGHLFEDKIYAFKYGPVIDSVYEEFKVYGNLEITDNEKTIEKQEKMEIQCRSRIIFAENGLKKVQSIDETLEKYGRLYASELVRITHKKGTPWDLVYNGDMYGEISDDEILKGHSKEYV